MLSADQPSSSQPPQESHQNTPSSSANDLFTPENIAKVQSVIEGLGQNNQTGSPQNNDTQNDLFSPDNIAKIKSIAEGLGITGNGGFQSPFGDDLFSAANIEKITSAIGDDHKNNERINLLMALKPYLSEQRSSKIDLAVKILQLTKFSGVFKDYFKK